MSLDIRTHFSVFAPESSIEDQDAIRVRIHGALFAAATVIAVVLVSALSVAIHLS